MTTDWSYQDIFANELKRLGTFPLPTADAFNADICPGCGTTATQMLKDGGCACSNAKSLHKRRRPEFPNVRDFDMLTAWENL